MTTTPTDQYKADSVFEIVGFVQSFFEQGTGKLLGSRQLDEIPEGRKCGSGGELRYETTESMRFTRATSCGPATAWLSAGAPVIDRIDAICGRLKRSYFNHPNNKQ